jgi:hypothetical protein
MTLKAINGDRPVNPPEWTSKFGRLFPELPAAKYWRYRREGGKKTRQLEEKMIAGFDGPKDGPDDEESDIPSLYAYLGQFIDHNLTFDPESKVSSLAIRSRSACLERGT